MVSSLIFFKKPAYVLSHPSTLLPISSNGLRKTNLNFPLRQCCPAIRIHRQLRHSYITRAAMGDGQENEEKEEEKPIILFKTKTEAVSDKKYMIHMTTLMVCFTLLLLGFIIVTFFRLFFRLFRLSAILIRQRATNLAVRTTSFRSIFSFLTPPLVPPTLQKPNNPWSAPILGSIMSITAVTLAPLYNIMHLTTVTDGIGTVFKYYKYKKSVIFWAGGCIFIQLFASVATLILLAKIWSKVCNIEDPNEQQGNGGGIQTKE